MTEPLRRPTHIITPEAATRPAGPHGADQLPYPEMGTPPDRESPPGTPRWVKAFGIGALVLVLLFAGLHLTGNVPSHMPGSSGPEHGIQAP